MTDILANVSFRYIKIATGRCSTADYACLGKQIHLQDGEEPLQPEKVAAAIKCTGIVSEDVDAVLADILWCG